MSNDEESASTSDELLGFIEGSLKNLTDLVQTANTLPNGSARDLYCTYSAFNRITEVLTENIIDLSNNILDMQDIKPKFKKEICLEFKDSNTLVDCNDQVLDNMDTLMDSMEGYKRTVAPPPPASGAHVSSWNKSPIIKTKTPSLPVGTPPPFKPQAAFKDAVDNSTIPWKPTITEKPNSVVELSLVPQFDEIGDVMGYAHPYATELQQYAPLSKFLAVSTDIAVTTENTKFTYINNLSELEQLVEHLRTVDVIAVDMEHNSQRSYQGITCLVQITTESGGDFVIDTLVLREHLHLLNEAFTDPCILKVFHGAYNDILWLQRDFAVYVVGLFDTYIAAQKLGLPVKSLQALVKTYCDVYIDKKYQTADWRIRPLPQAMIDYARMDTHYLIYIYKCMTKDLAGKACGEAYVYSVHEQSRIICMAKYEKPKAIDENSHLLLVSRYHFSPQQMIAAKWLFKWRDEVARKEDEGVQYVMPDHMLVRLAELQPRDVQGVLGIWNPLPPLLRQYLTQVHTILLASREFSAPNPMPSSAHLAAWPAEVPSAFAPHDTLSWAGNSEELPDASLGHQQLYGITGNDPSADNTHGDITNMSDLINGPHRSNSGSGDFARGTSAIAHKFKITTTSSGKAVFLPPYDRYCKYRSITKDDETKKLRQTEAKIFAINKNSSIPVTRIIEKDLVSKHEEAHLNIDSAP